MEKRYLNIEQLCEYTGTGRTKAAAFGKEIGALRKIGRRSIYDKKVIDAYFDNMGKAAEGQNTK